MKKLLSILLLMVMVMGGLMSQRQDVHAIPNATGYCNNCGKTVSFTDYMPVGGSCAAGWTVQGNCPDCNAIIAGTIPAGHSYYLSDTIDPDCIEYGARYYECEICHEVKEEEVKALGHNFVETSNTTSCTAAGVKASKCSRCGETRTENLSAYGHNYQEKIITKATCETAGKKQQTCTRCNDSITQTIKALGHKWSDWKVTKEAVCEEAGEETRVCSRCKKDEKREIPALEHVSAEMTVKKEPTCTEEGYKSSECELCGKEFRESIPALGHEYGEFVTVKEATLGKEGSKEKSCERCEDVVSETLPALTFGEYAAKEPLVVGGGAAAVVGGAGAAIYMALAKKTAAKTASSIAGKAAGANVARKAIEKLETKTISVLLSDSENAGYLIESFKKTPFLEVDKLDPEAAAEGVEENGPDMVIFELTDEMKLDSITDLIDEIDDDEIRYAIVGEKEIIRRHAEPLKILKDGKKIVSYTRYGKLGTVVSDIILPLYRPEMDVETTLDGVSLALSAVGLDWAAGIVELLAEGNNIREIIQDGDPEAEDKLSIIASACNIIGLDAGEVIENLADYIEEIKHLKKKAEENLTTDSKETA